MSNLLRHGLRRPPVLLKASATLPSLRSTFSHRSSTDNKEDNSQGVAEKARSTAEEFYRQALDKSEEIRLGTQEVLEDVKEAVVGDREEDKEKDKEEFKEKVEEGKYWKIGRD